MVNYRYMKKQLNFSGEKISSFTLDFFSADFNTNMENKKMNINGKRIVSVKENRKDIKELAISDYLEVDGKKFEFSHTFRDFRKSAYTGKTLRNRKGKVSYISRKLASPVVVYKATTEARNNLNYADKLYNEWLIQEI